MNFKHSQYDDYTLYYVNELGLLRRAKWITQNSRTVFFQRMINLRLLVSMTSVQPCADLRKSIYIV